MSVSDFRSCERTPLWISRAIASSNRISVSDAPPSSVARREEKLFVSEINFNDGVEDWFVPIRLKISNSAIPMKAKSRSERSEKAALDRTRADCVRPPNTVSGHPIKDAIGQPAESSFCSNSL
jgi:hypothetical protein